MADTIESEDQRQRFFDQYIQDEDDFFEEEEGQRSYFDDDDDDEHEPVDYAETEDENEADDENDQWKSLDTENSQITSNEFEDFEEEEERHPYIDWMLEVGLDPWAQKDWALAEEFFAMQNRDDGDYNEEEDEEENEEIDDEDYQEEKVIGDPGQEQTIPIVNNQKDRIEIVQRQPIQTLQNSNEMEQEEDEMMQDV